MSPKVLCPTPHLTDPWYKSVEPLVELCSLSSFVGVVLVLFCVIHSLLFVYFAGC